jgi:glycosyltransferase involved in cell wall biosynthesis
MRVLHILNDVTDRGNGIVNTAVDLAIEQVRQGLVVALASAGGGYQPLLERAGVAHLTLDQSRRPAQLLRAMGRFHSQLREFQPEVVHAHTRTGVLLARFFRCFHPFVLVGHVHNVHDRDSILMGLADRVIAVSGSVAETMVVHGIAKHKIRVVLNRTLDSRRVPALAMVEPALLKRPSIVTVCGMSQRKGIEDLIDAFEMIAREFQDAHLYLVGDGPDRQRFECQAERSSCSDRIHFEGYQALPQAYMLSSDVFVLASRRESFGLVLIEAREAGCAIIATNVDGVAEALDGGRAGRLVPQRDAPALAGALRQMLSNTVEQERWRTRAKEGIAGFRVRYMASETKAVYDELASCKAALYASNAQTSNSPAILVKTRSLQPADDRESQAVRS